MNPVKPIVWTKPPMLINAMVSLTVSTTLLSGCTHPKTTSESTAINAPAIRINVTAAAQKELQKTISGSMHLSTIGISQNALTQNNTVIIEKIRLLGFDLSTPTVFKLLKNKGQCILINQKTKQRYHLAKTQCQVIQ